MGTGRTDTGFHAFAPASVLEIGNHVTRLNTFTDGVGQRSFKAVTCIELYATLVGNEEDNQSVVLALLSHSPRIEQLVAKVKAFGFANALYHGYYGLYARFLFQLVEHLVHVVAGFGSQDIVGIGHVSGLVLQMYFGQIIGCIDGLCPCYHT